MLNTLKKLAAVALAAALCASCSFMGNTESAEKVEGQEIIEKSMKAYNEQNSGGYEAYDNTTGEMTERFVYQYDEVGFMIYLSEQYNDGKVYKEYCSGYATYVEEDGVGKKLPKSDDRAVMYTHDYSRNSKATDAIFGFIASGVENVERKDTDSGSTLTYTYSPKDAGIAVDGGTLDSYVIEYTLDSFETVRQIHQVAKGKNDDGSELIMDYTVKIIYSDGAGEIENPIKVESAEENSEG